MGPAASAVAYIVLLIGGGVILWSRRFQFTIWWVAFGSAAIYSIPLLFGFDFHGRELTPAAQGVLIAVMVMCLTAAVFFERSRTLSSNYRVSRVGANVMVSVFVLASWAVFLLVLALYGWDVLRVHKLEAAVHGGLNILWRATAGIAFIGSLILRKRIGLVASAVPLVALLFAGDRTAIGMTLIGSTWLLMRDRQLRIGRAVAIGGITLFVGAFLFFGKVFQAQWSSGTFESFPALVDAVAAQGAEGVARTEPFVTASVLNGLTTLQIRPDQSVVVEALAQLLVVPSAFGFESSSFNDFYQPLLFPDHRERSLAYSYWGEGYLRGGWPGLFGFMLVYIFGLAGFARLTRSHLVAIQIFGYCGGSYWAFYIHRNSLVSIVAYERHILLVLIALITACIVIRALLPTNTNRTNFGLK